MRPSQPLYGARSEGSWRRGVRMRVCVRECDAGVARGRSPSSAPPSRSPSSPRRAEASPAQAHRHGVPERGGNTVVGVERRQERREGGDERLCPRAGHDAVPEEVQHGVARGCGGAHEVQKPQRVPG